MDFLSVQILWTNNRALSYQLRHYGQILEILSKARGGGGGGGGGVQLHFCTWPPDFCQMYMYKMYKNVQNMFFPYFVNF